MQNDTTVLTGITRSNFEFECPAIFNLFIDGSFIAEIAVKGISIPKDHLVDDDFEKISVWINGHLDKKQFEGKVDAHLILKR